MDCSGKTALVTGAGAGIGRACALALAAHGADLIVTDINEADAHSTANMIEANGQKAIALHHDVSQETAWEQVFAYIDNSQSGLDILVNNAGIAIGSPITEMTLEQWQAQTAVNIDGVFLGTRGAIPRMAAKGAGSIINISSVAGLIGAPGLSGYCATKGAVRLFTKAVAIEMTEAGLDIRVNSVHPGIIDTEIWQKSMTSAVEAMMETPNGGSNQISSAVAQAAVPGGKLGTVEDIANAVVFLASSASRYMTGAELVVDHGMTAR